MSGVELKALAERCEALSGPDREVDALICIALGLSHDNVMVGVDGWCISSATNPNPYHSPAYTASLDAAMSLVPERYASTVANWWCEGYDKPPFFADCADIEALRRGNDDVVIVQAWAQSHALALCAAALKSRATLSQHSGERS